MAKKNVEFNPVKETEDKKAQAVIWSTASLNAAVEAKKKGLPLKANPFLNNDIQLLKPNLVFRRTQEEIEDWQRCAEDKVYFGNKCFLKTPTGVQRVTMRDYQEDYLRMCKEEPWTIWLAARQSGKSVTNGVDMLHELLFDVDRAALIVSKSGQHGIDLLAKIKDMYRYLPWHLKAGINIWNVHQVSFDNNSSVKTLAPSTEAGVGDTVNFLLLDEFAWMPMTDDECQLYLDNILPTISQDETSKVRIMSTQNGRNLFYRLFTGAVTGTNSYKPFRTDWNQVPQYNKKTGKWEKRTEEWKNAMIKKMGSPESFYYMYGTQFMSSDKSLCSRECLSRLHDREKVFRELTEEEKETLILPENMKAAIRLRPDITLQHLKEGYYAILKDLAEGCRGDYTVFHIFEIGVDESNSPVFEQVGYWRANDIELEEAALSAWVICQRLFTEEHYIVSVELNTYGILFENYLFNLNEPETHPEWLWRFQNGEEIDYACLASYKKGKEDEELPGMKTTSSKTIPGIRWNSSNKPVACQLLKGMIEKDTVKLYDIATIVELEAFEDKTGKGHYKASYGHDDIIMTCVQIPKLIETVKFKAMMEDIILYKNSNNTQQEYEGTIYDNMEMYDNMMEISPILRRMRER